MFTTFATDLGYMALATLDGEVVGLTFGHHSAAAAAKSIEAFHGSAGSAQLAAAREDESSETIEFHEHLVGLLEQFAAGEEVHFARIPIDMKRMTPFQKQVVAACRRISWGKTVSYGQLAVKVGHPGAARAVGSVMRKNRIPLIVPCHRVLGSGGALGGYSAPSGLAMKRRLLDMERERQLAGMF